MKKKGPIRWTPHSRGVLLQSSERRPVPLVTHPISVEAIADQVGANLAADTIRVNKLSVVQRRRHAQMIQKIAFDRPATKTARENTGEKTSEGVLESCVKGAASASKDDLIFDKISRRWSYDGAISNARRSRSWEKPLARRRA